MTNQLGVIHMWLEGGLVIQLTAIALISMSVISWTVIIVKGLMIHRSKKQAKALHHFWHSADLNEGLKTLSASDEKGINTFKLLALEGQSAMAHHRHTEKHLHDHLDLSDWMTGSLRNAIDDAQEKLSSGLALLASIGSTAPFVGLFGTVWGIYHALLTISEVGQASIDKVAGPVGEALIMTAFGLAVAIPAVLGYNALVRGNKFIVGKLNRFAYDLHSYYVTGNRIQRPDSDKLQPVI